MKKSNCKTVLFILLLAGLAGWPDSMLAQEKAVAEKKVAPGTNQPAPSAKKPGAGPFHGKLAAVDKVAKTITVGKRTFHITSATKIRKGDKPVILDDGVVGEECSGYVKPTEDGKLIATTVNFGPKNPQAKGTEKKPSPSDEKK